MPTGPPARWRVGSIPGLSIGWGMVDIRGGGANDGDGGTSTESPGKILQPGSATIPSSSAKGQEEAEQWSVDTSVMTAAFLNQTKFTCACVFQAGQCVYAKGRHLQRRNSRHPDPQLGVPDAPRAAALPERLDASWSAAGKRPCFVRLQIRKTHRPPRGVGIHRCRMDFSRPQLTATNLAS